VARIVGWAKRSIPAARLRPSRCDNRVPQNKRGRRECRVFGCTRSLVCKGRKTHELVTTGKPKSSDIPCAMVLTLLRALPGVHDLLVTVAREISASGPRGPTSRSRKLNASPGASEPHDFVVRSVPLVARHTRVHRIPRSTSGDDWPNAPLHRGGTDEREPQVSEYRKHYIFRARTLQELFIPICVN